MTDRIVLHEYAASGNCYKIRLAAALSGVPIERRQYDIMAGETRTPEFIANINPNGRIPVLQVGDRFIPESNAAAYFIAEGSPLIPADPFDHADMLHWMFWEQYSHEPNIATLRFWMGWVGMDNLTQAQRLQVAGKREAGNAALKLMDDHLAGCQWLVGDSPTLADLCLFAYTHVAEGGGFELGRYRQIQDWIARVEALPSFVAIDA